MINKQELIKQLQNVLAATEAQAVYLTGINDGLDLSDFDLLVVADRDQAALAEKISAIDGRIDLRRIFSRKEFEAVAPYLPQAKLELVYGQDLRPATDHDKSAERNIVRLSALFFTSFLRNYYYLKAKPEKDAAIILKNLNDFSYVELYLEEIPFDLAQFIGKIKAARANYREISQDRLAELLDEAIDFSWSLVGSLNESLKKRYEVWHPRYLFLGKEPTIFVPADVDACRDLVEKNLSAISRMKILYLPLGFQFIFADDDFARNYSRLNLASGYTGPLSYLKLLLKRSVALWYYLKFIHFDIFRCFRADEACSVKQNGQPVKIKYLINSFFFQKQLFEKHLSEHFDFDFFPPFVNTRLRAAFYVPLNIFCLCWYYLSGKIKKYRVVHFNRAEAFLLFRKFPGQISIFEVHGFDVGVKGEAYLADLHSGFKKRIGRLIDRLIEGRIKKNIAQVDLFYCSTPDLVEPIEQWCGRKPIWLPNPIDMAMFKPDGETIKLPGKPACFLAARLHGDKKPEVAIEIFRNHIKPRFKEATLHLIDTGELASHYKKVLDDKETFFWHGYMGKEELAAKLRGADLVFGDFSIGALSLLPMQIMALKKPIVTLDRYEAVKVEPAGLSSLALDLLEKPGFREEFVRKNFDYLIEHHSGEAVARRHLQNLSNLL